MSLALANKKRIALKAAYLLEHKRKNRPNAYTEQAEAIRAVVDGLTAAQKELAELKAKGGTVKEVESAQITTDETGAQVNIWLNSSRGMVCHTLALVEENDSGLLFAVDASYIEQDVDTVVSPYNNGPLAWAEEQDDGKAS